MKSVRNYSASSVKYGGDGHLLTLNAAGVVTGHDWAALNDDAYVQVRKYCSTGLVLKLDRSDVDISGDIAMRQLEGLAGVDPGSFRPGAFVVARRDVGLFRDLAWTMATVGMVAAVFTNSDDAANFARQKGQVWAAELAFRRLQNLQALRD